MDPLILVPSLLATTTFITSAITSRFASYKLLDTPKKYELLARASSTAAHLYLFYNGFYLTSEDHVNHFNRVTTGYMIYDLAHMATFQKAWPIYFHHITYILIYYNNSYFPQEYHVKFAQLTWILESTSPFLTLCWFLNTFEYPINKIHKLVRIVSFVYWSIARVFIFPYMVYIWNIPAFYIGSLPFYGLQLYWFWLLLKKIT